jgi:hypothetical protein
VPASQVTDAFDWWPIAELLAQRVDAPLLAEGVAGHRVRRPARSASPRQAASTESQLPLELD